MHNAHETTSGGNHQFFFIFNVIVIYQLPPQRLQYSDFQSHFSVLKINGIFPIFFSLKIIKLGDQFLLIFEIL